MLKFLKNRSPWVALHEMDELREMKNVSFAVIHHTPVFEDRVALHEKNQLTGEEFLIRCEEVRKANAGPFRASNPHELALFVKTKHGA